MGVDVIAVPAQYTKCPQADFSNNLCKEYNTSLGTDCDHPGWKLCLGVKTRVFNEIESMHITSSISASGFDRLSELHYPIKRKLGLSARGGSEPIDATLLKVVIKEITDQFLTNSKIDDEYKRDIKEVVGFLKGCLAWCEKNNYAVQLEFG